jgi:hypothetical protein
VWNARKPEQVFPAALALSSFCSCWLGVPHLLISVDLTGSHQEISAAPGKRGPIRLGENQVDPFAGTQVHSQSTLAAVIFGKQRLPASTPSRSELQCCYYCTGFTTEHNMYLSFPVSNIGRSFPYSWVSLARASPGHSQVFLFPLFPGA